SLIPLLGIGIWERDLITNRTEWNSIILEIIEADPAQSYTMEQTIALHRYPDTVAGLISRAKHSGLAQTMVSQLTTFRGNDKWVRIRVQAQYKNKICTNIYGTLEDITKQVNIVLKLQGRDHRFAKAFNHAPNGMALVSLDGNFTKVNLSFCKILGCEKKLLLKQQFQQLAHSEDLEKITAMISSLVAVEKRTDQAEVRFLHGKGHFLWTVLNVSIVHDDRHRPSYMIFQLKDISERIKNLKTINAQNSRLQNFAHIISHNLRSHGGNINSLAEMALAEADPQEQTNLILMLRKTSKRLLETLVELNEIVKSQQLYPVSTSSIRVKEEVNRVLEILSASISGSKAVIELDISSAEQLTTNSAYFESIIINLITNAIKYRHPDRDPQLKISMDYANGLKQLIVSDNGLGIDLVANGEKIFQLYHTFHNHPDSRGVGLYLVKQQIEELGGNIQVESRLGHGTRFLLSFPG
ncbi:MAG: PAS domain S-box protein, partial [Pedobacter sp.]